VREKYCRFYLISSSEQAHAIIYVIAEFELKQKVFARRKRKDNSTC